ncbi:hypothetical protein AB0M39_10070 [Streptomyces sp. NPDC051907]|uniref:hypothetical protein n=1 Tax=Streptomyces sp. NPDC051907 TaxID=3155284 RepID=UPI003443B86A
MGDGVQPPDVTRTMLWLLLSRTPPRPASPDAELRTALAAQWNKDFTPVVPLDRGQGAGGAAQEPLAQAVRAAAGHGWAWWREGPGAWRPEPAAEVLRRLDLSPVRLDVRPRTDGADDLPALAHALHHHVRLRTLLRAGAAGTQRLSALLAGGAEHGPGGSPGAGPGSGSGSTSSAGAGATSGSGEQRLAQPYVLRRAWQLIFTSVDQLIAQGGELAHWTVHCGRPPTGCAARQLLCLHRAAFLAERQQALVLDPRHNGGRLLFPAAGPSAGGGFSDAVGAAAAHLEAIKAHRHASEREPDAPERTAEVAESLERAWRTVASLFLTLAELSRQTGSEPAAGLWRRLADSRTPLDADRSADDVVADTARWLESEFQAEPAPPG